MRSENQRQPVPSSRRRPEAFATARRSCYDAARVAPVVKWISRRPPEPEAGVRVPSGAPSLKPRGKHAGPFFWGDHGFQQSRSRLASKHRAMPPTASAGTGLTAVSNPLGRRGTSFAGGSPPAPAGETVWRRWPNALEGALHHQRSPSQTRRCGAKATRRRSGRTRPRGEAGASNAARARSSEPADGGHGPGICGPACRAGLSALKDAPSSSGPKLLPPGSRSCTTPDTDAGGWMCPRPRRGGLGTSGATGADASSNPGGLRFPETTPD